MTPTLPKRPVQRKALLQKTARTRGRARGGGRFVSGIATAEVHKKQHNSVCTAEALQKKTVLKQPDSAASGAAKNHAQKAQKSTLTQLHTADHSLLATTLAVGADAVAACCRRATVLTAHHLSLLRRTSGQNNNRCVRLPNAAPRPKTQLPISWPRAVSAGAGPVPGKREYHAPKWA